MPFTTQSRLCGVTPSLQHENDFIKLIQIGKETITAHPQCEKKKNSNSPLLDNPVSISTSNHPTARRKLAVHNC